MHRRTLLATGLAAAVLAPAAHAQAQRFAAAAEYSDRHNGAALIIQRSGVLLASRYVNANAAAALHPLGTATRVFAALLAAALAEDRLLSLDEPAAMTLGDWGAHPIKSTITLRTLLNGTSGIAGDAPDIAALIALEPQAPPHAAFVDDGAGYRLFVEIARRKLEDAALDRRRRGPQIREIDPARYLAMRVFTPIGAGTVQFARDTHGAPRFDDGAAISADGWARVGELIQRDGVYRGAHVVSPSAVQAALTGSFIEGRRGIGLWLAASVSAPAPRSSDLWTLGARIPADLAMAAGGGGQRLYVSPSLRIVIARLSTGAPDPTWSDAAFLTRIFTS